MLNRMKNSFGGMVIGCLGFIYICLVWIFMGYLCGLGLHWSADYWISLHNHVATVLPLLPFVVLCMLIGPLNGLSLLFIFITWIFSFCM